MKTLSKEMLIYAVPSDSSPEGFELILMPPEKKWYMNDSDVCVGSTIVSFLPPDNMSRDELAAKAIETLRDKQKQAMAEAQRRCDKLQAQINQLLMISYKKPEAENDSNVIHAEFKREATFNDDLPF